MYMESILKAVIKASVFSKIAIEFLLLTYLYIKENNKAIEIHGSANMLDIT